MPGLVDVAVPTAPGPRGPASPRSEALVERAGRALGSPLRLVIRADEPTADAAWAAVGSVFAAVDAAMSRFREDSELTALCRLAPQPAEGSSRMLVRALTAADRARRVTDGRFEPRIVSALEKIGYTGVPQRSATEPSRPADWLSGDDWEPGHGRVVQRCGREGPLALPDPVDLGGIGKGLALRWAATAIDRALAESAGPALRPGGDDGTSYLLDAGGDIVLSGAPANGEPWHVGIEDPRGGTAPIATIKGSGRLGVATSSTRRLRWEHRGEVVHHLIDPRTGAPAAGGLLAVTVAGPDPAWAEVWSKALFVEGRTGIAALARRRGLAAWWVTTDGPLEMTAAARQLTVWVAAEV